MIDRLRLMAEARPNCEATLRAKQQFLARMREGPVALLPEMAKLQHYEVPPEFFQKVLGKNDRQHSDLHRDRCLQRGRILPTG